VLFKIGPLTVSTYGVLVATAFIAATAVAARRAQREGIHPDRIYDLGLYALVAAIVGSRLLYVITQWSYYAAHPLDAFKIWQGGLVFYGGLLLGIPVVIGYLRRHGLPVWQVGDILAPSVALGQSIGRVGCFAAGCDFGTETDVPWAVTFTHPESLAKLGVPLHPTQLYESAVLLLLFFGLSWLLRRRRFHGQVFWTYIGSYAVLRFFLEFFRGDVDRGFVIEPWLSTSQFIGLLLLPVAVVMYRRLGSRKAASR